MAYPDITNSEFAMPRTAAGDAIKGGVAGANKLWLPLWSGEVIHAYDQFNMFESLVTSKTLTGGQSWDFPTTGVVSLKASWDAGVELSAGTVSPSTTFKVVLDKRPMAAHFECDNIDLLITQWDYRGELARQAGLTLANTRDKQLAVSLVASSALAHLGAAFDLHTTTASFQDPGVISTSVLASAATDTEGLLVLQQIENYMVVCQENDVVIGQVYCAVTPKVFQVIRSLGIPRTPTVNSNTAYVNNPLFTGGQAYGGTGMGFDGMNSMMDSLEYMGCKIVKTNHIPKTDLNGAAIGSSKYNLNCHTSGFDTGTANVTTTCGAVFSIYGIIFQSEAVAALSLQGMKVDSIADVRRNTQFTVASMMKGTGVIRPEMVKLLISSATANTTRARLTAHLNSSGTSSGATVGNLDSGFGAEYKITTTYA